MQKGAKVVLPHPIQAELESLNFKLSIFAHHIPPF